MELSRSSPEFQQLEYKLKVQLSSTTLRVTRCHQLSDVTRAYNYEKTCQGIVAVESWMDAIEVFETDRFADIQKILPVVDLSKITFPVGPKPVIQDSTAEHCLVAFKVAVGRALYSDQLLGAVPEGYDSVCYEAKDSKTGASQYRYLVDDSTSQIVPLFLVSFTYDPRLEERTRKRPACEECKKSEAVFYSSLFHANLCEPCSKKGHSGIELAKKQSLVPISKGPATFGPCQFHPSRVVEYYCSTCCAPVCVDCKMVGSHASGEQGNHRLVLAKDALNSCLDNISQRDAVMQAQKATIEHQLNKIGARGESIAQNVENIKRMIQQKCEQAILEAETLGQEKLTGLLADDIELRRQLAEIDSLQHYLDYQRTSFDGIQHLLMNWKTHNLLVNETKKFEHFTGEVDIKSDLRCKFTIEISTDETKENDTPVLATVDNSSSSNSGNKSTSRPVAKPGQDTPTPKTPAKTQTKSILKKN